MWAVINVKDSRVGPDIDDLLGVTQINIIPEPKITNKTETVR